MHGYGYLQVIFRYVSLTLSLCILGNTVNNGYSSFVDISEELYIKSMFIA